MTGWTGGNRIVDCAVRVVFLIVFFEGPSEENPCRGDSGWRLEVTYRPVMF